MSLVNSVLMPCSDCGDVPLRPAPELVECPDCCSNYQLPLDQLCDTCPTPLGERVGLSNRYELGDGSWHRWQTDARRNLKSRHTKTSSHAVKEAMNEFFLEPSINATEMAAVMGHDLDIPCLAAFTL